MLLRTLVGCLLVLIANPIWAQTPESSATDGAVKDYALKDGDVVGFLGDSITAERSYGKHIELYTLMHFPQRKIHFVNLGIGGDTAAGGLERLQRDVFDRGITVLTVAYGINDIGWGVKADDQHRQQYLDSIRQIVRQCRQNGVRVFVCSAAVTAEDPDQSEESYLQQMCDEGLEIAAEEGGKTITVQRTMREIQKRIKAFNQSRPEAERRSLHVADGIHLNELGQLAMAYAILRGLGAPEVVSFADIAADENRVMDQQGCEIRQMEMSEAGGRFVREDQALPYNNGPFAGLSYGLVPIPEINRYQLKVTGLASGKYRLNVDDRGVGTYTQDQLNAGVDISSATADGWHPGGPWDAQAYLVKHLTDARNRLAETVRTRETYFGANGPVASAWQKEAAQANRQLEQLQRQTAQPRPYRFQLTQIQD